VDNAPIHIRPTAPLALRALLPGDPGRALLLAQLLLDEPRMFNHHRGLWGYTGDAQDGLPLTIQSTGMGGPSIAIVVAELIDLGLRRAIRVGTAGALDAGLRLGDVVIADEAIASDGTSRRLGAGERAQADPALSAALRDAAPQARTGAVVSTDLFYERDASGEPELHGRGALAVEMEAATLFALSARRGIAAGCVLAVSDLLGADGRVRIADDELTHAAERIGRIGAAALIATEPNSSQAAPRSGRSAAARP
jgi:DeoD family purine-nucleoside phosphorylase